jgi:tripartite-type tricarboxylate transporter receptor subunit TctC
MKIPTEEFTQTDCTMKEETMNWISGRKGIDLVRVKAAISSCLLGLLVGLSMVMVSGTHLEAAGSDYPNRPISLIVPYAPGGLIDTSARAFADVLQKQLKQPVVIVNKTGGGQAVAGKHVVTAKPDGYTLGYFTFSAANPEAYAALREPSYSSEELVPIAQVFVSTLCIAVKGDAPYKSFKDLVRYAKENPGMKVGTQGVDSSGWLLMNSIISKAEGTKFTNVPFRGGSEIVAALLGGHVPIGSPDYVVVRPLREANKLTPLALLATKRPPFAADVPTIGELGYPFPAAVQSPIGLFGPRTLPQEIVTKLDKLTQVIAEDPSFQKVCAQMNMQISYENSASYSRIRKEHKETLLSIFKEQGITKK